MLIANWGNYPKIDATIQKIGGINELKEVIGSCGPCIARGMGRCYGDASLAKKIISLRKLDHFLAFDEDSGILECQAGTTLEEILEAFVPRGWFLPVTPGTKFVSVGGAIAGDIHGKNHHKEGTFTNHLLSLKVLTGNKVYLDCDRENRPELFKATCGGMGLTGVISHARFRLKPIQTAFLRKKALKAKDLSETFAFFEQYHDVTYSVAWLDNLAKGRNLGRSIMFLGEHAGENDLPQQWEKNPLRLPNKRKKTIPFFLPNHTLNSWSIRCFNFLYYHSQLGHGREAIVDYEDFFYPLDLINHWNRIYGKRGFLQYQIVLPLEGAEKGMVQILQKIAGLKKGSFLAVLKLFGDSNENYLSFPMKGYTLALDFPISKWIFPFLDELDKIVLDYGGRIYLAKDARMKAQIFQNSYPQLKKFLEIKMDHDPQGQFSSLQSQRLGI